LKYASSAISTSDPPAIHRDDVESFFMRCKKATGIPRA
jgi:hypothetical protein